MTDQLNRAEEDLLQSALETAFQPTHLRRVSVVLNTQPSTDPLPPQEPPAPSTASSSSDVAAQTPAEPGTSADGESGEEPEEWKREYDAHVSEWRARSAEQREKAEVERTRWEAIRASESSSSRHGREDDVKEWESVSVSLGPGSTRVGSARTSVADGRDLVAGEGQGRKSQGVANVPQSTTSSPPESGSAHDRGHGSGEKWDEVSTSMTSSFPSMSFPSDPHSPVSSQQHRDLTHGHHPHENLRDQRPAPPVATTTSSIFDPSLSAKTRTLALFSSLAINLLLPFVNGVMLGFGEIFARNAALKWFGIGGGAKPGSVAANVGVNANASSPAKGGKMVFMYSII
ncbi:hypothetical protein EUX98_g953 [Antrodiella citrinella]|uniref:Uncharacterized protein n=1 Tax=Antrodiella citrinella TaxID=2447956 RepID=A0A4S4N5K2_9APHY|nr:hypothetical protein EUX98_g953 [Antrodiella citrinella]